MSEEIYRIWDVLIKTLTVTGAAISIFYGIERFEISSRREFGKEFYKEKLKFYVDLTAITSQLANGDLDMETRNKLIDDFETINLGQKYLFVKDSQLLENIRRFNDVVTHIKANKIVFTNTGEQTQEVARRYAVSIAERSGIVVDQIINQLHSTNK